MFHPGLNNKQICNLRTINYYKTKKPQDFRIEAFDLKVIPIGFEPMTYRLEICCSIQLSYGTIAIIFCGAKLTNLLK
jgi:hypothetical protein